ncbi:uncharacterized protein LOC143686121 [Tamandua tetradactyla]|uniref:uncharacterized protein LOC143686121 n=1 Tax=Tamandua tetradactyla TaxID=48850 RepID=UPI004053D249
MKVQIYKDKDNRRRVFSQEGMPEGHQEDNTAVTLSAGTPPTPVETQETFTRRGSTSTLPPGLGPNTCPFTGMAEAATGPSSCRGHLRGTVIVHLLGIPVSWLSILNH